jgi:hypothetical protein
MSPAEYILDPRFRLNGCAFKESLFGKPFWLDGVDVPNYLHGLDKENLLACSHNWLFDGCALAWHYGFIPKISCCTLSVSRATIQYDLTSLSLESIARYLKLGVKGKSALINAKGMDLQGIKAAGFYDAYVEYALNDVELCAQIFKALVVGEAFPKDELATLDMIMRMATQPNFVLDKNILHQHLHTVTQAKEVILNRLGCDTKAIRQDEVFANMLRSYGVEPPKKISLTTGLERYAFAKTDAEFLELEEHPDPMVQALVAARLGAKSTIEETRTQRFINISNLSWPITLPGNMPMPIKFSGAHTHRCCLTGDTIIATLRDNRVVYICLSHLQLSDLVWDGDMFVRHQGLAYAGVKNVIEYDEIIGTPDHRVWTLECGYCKLEEAKARGYSITRGNIPDATRIDPTVLWPNTVLNQDQVYMCQVQSSNELYVERLNKATHQGLVPVLCNERKDGGQTTFAGNVGKGGASQPGRGKTPAENSCCSTTKRSHSNKGDYSLASTKTIAKMASRRVEDSYVYSATCISEMHKPKGNPLSFLWGTWNYLWIYIHSNYGRLAFEEPRPKTVEDDSRPHRNKWTLRTGKPPVGDSNGADEKPKLMATWDIVSCGPRNRFMANGRIVHNSGDWRMNVQNLVRGSDLRKSLRAPPGYKVITVDSSQIEARLVAFLTGETTLLQQFAEGADVYCSFASKVFKREITKANKPERFIGKTAILGLGFGLGWEKFHDRIKTDSKNALGGAMINMSIAQAMAVVLEYRRLFPSIPAAWTDLGTNAMSVLSGRVTKPMMFGPVVVEKGQIYMPGRLKMFYHNLNFKNKVEGDPNSKSGWRFTFAGKEKYLYGGKLLENIVQYLDRILVFDAALRIQKRLAPYRLAQQAHDENCYVVKEEDVVWAKHILLEEMTRRPSWGENLPIMAEIGVGDSYGEAK